MYALCTLHSPGPYVYHMKNDQVVFMIVMSILSVYHSGQGVVRASNQIGMSSVSPALQSERLIPVRTQAASGEQCHRLMVSVVQAEVGRVKGLVNQELKILKEMMVSVLT